MQKLHFQVFCQAYYRTEMEVPDGLTKEEAFQYAKEHLEDVPMEELEYIPDSDEMMDEDLDVPGIVYLTDN